MGDVHRLSVGTIRDFQKVTFYAGCVDTGKGFKQEGEDRDGSVLRQFVEMLDAACGCRHSFVLPSDPQLVPSASPGVPTYRKETECVASLCTREGADAYVLGSAKTEGGFYVDLMSLLPTEAFQRTGRFRIIVEFTPEEP